MRKGLFLCLALSLAAGTRTWTPKPWGPPAVVTEPDCPNPFVMDIHHRHNPEELGSVTRDGYPVMLTPSGESRYVMPRGMRLPDPVRLPGYGLPDRS